jgi:hypothetical protein
MLPTYLEITDNKWFEYLQWSKYTGDASQGGRSGKYELLADQGVNDPRRICGD